MMMMMHTFCHAIEINYESNTRSVLFSFVYRTFIDHIWYWKVLKFLRLCHSKPRLYFLSSRRQL